jgi:hypothetical protein
MLGLDAKLCLAVATTRESDIEFGEAMHIQFADFLCMGY